MAPSATGTKVPDLAQMSKDPKDRHQTVSSKSIMMPDRLDDTELAALGYSLSSTTRIEFAIDPVDV